MFTQKQIQSLLDIIETYHLDFIGRELGSSSLSSYELEVLKNYGIDIEKYPELSKLDHTYVLGLLSQSLDVAQFEKLTYKDLKRFIQSDQFVPLSQYEKDVLDMIRTQSYSDIKGLGRRIANEVETGLIEEQKKRRLEYEKIIRDEAKRAVYYKESVRQLASRIGNRTDDWAKDLVRISSYIIHDAYEHGKAAGIIRSYKEGEETLVYKQVLPGACKHCISNYLEGDEIGSKPKIFTLGDLMSNGSNIGRKVAEYKPTLGPLHPHCRCEMFMVPKNSKWDPEEKRFVVQRVLPERKSRAKITITTSE